MNAKQQNLVQKAASKLKLLDIFLYTSYCSRPKRILTLPTLASHIFIGSDF